MGSALAVYAFDASAGWQLYRQGGREPGTGKDACSDASAIVQIYCRIYWIPFAIVGLDQLLLLMLVAHIIVGASADAGTATARYGF
jgi:hypothetical protein